MKKPKISVLMPVYNGERHLREAIDSILRQSFDDFEFIIINDGSNDNSEKIILSYKDPRIKYHKNDFNLGLAETCNRGICLATGMYIARMDCDDISLPNRLGIQIDFMEKNPNIGICGTWVKSFGDYSYSNFTFKEHDDIKANLLFHTSLAHPSLMMRKDLFMQNNLFYDKKFEPADDYNLWTRMVDATRMANVPQVLLLYRVHKNSVSATRSQNRLNGAISARKYMLSKINIIPSSEELMIHNSTQIPDGYSAQLFFQKSVSWLSKIREANKKVNYFNERSLEMILAERFLDICVKNIAKHRYCVKGYLQSPMWLKNIGYTFPKMVRLAGEKIGLRN